MPASATPYLPATDDAVVERLPSAGNSAAQNARRLHALLSRAPQQLDLALRTAGADIDLGRAEADPRYYGRAESALAPWLTLDEPPIPVLLLRATLRQSRHEFGPALADLDQVIAAEPANAQARLVRAVVRQVRGDLTGARDDCHGLDGLAAPLVVTLCLAGVDAVSGEAARSLDALGPALAAQGAPSLRLWGLTILGETAARLDRPAAAEAAFRQALALGLRDVYLLSAFADFLLDQGRPAEVETLLQGETRIDPLLLRLALAAQALHRPSGDRLVADLSERFAAARRRGDTTHLREEARFTLALLGDPARAVDLARANWAVQREPADARILLEAARAAKAPQAAVPVLDFLRDSHLEDATLARLAAQS